MNSLTQAVQEAQRVLEANGGFSSQLLLIETVQKHVTGTHITTTYPDGSAGRKEVVWHPDEQRFVDWGNDYWLFGPKSYHGRSAGDKWILGARDNHYPVVKQILDRSKFASKFDNIQALWRLYWQLLLMDQLRHSDDAIVDLHLQPLDVTTLEPKPVIARIVDRIVV